jgi:Protein of unknown function (DUF1566)
MRSRLRFYWATVVFGAALFLSACGGGTTSKTGPILSLSGTAATGAAIANSTVTFKCSDRSTGVATGTATTTATGGYAYTFEPGAAAVPCMAQVQIKDGSGAVIDTLHSMVTTANSSSATTLNLTPLTESVLAVALGQEDVSAYFAALTNSQTTALITLDTAAAWTAIKAQLTAQSISYSSITDVFSQVFSANSTGYDLVLDNLKTKGLTTEYLYRASKGLALPPDTATGLMNDTGIDWCSENITTLNVWANDKLCSALTWAQRLWGEHQDAYSGRDAAAKAGTLTKIGSGMAGFDFTRIGAIGKSLKIQNGTWSDTGTEAAGTKWDCVRDNNTGLMWEVKRNELVNGVKHLRHKDNTYGWYNPDSATNGGAAGYPNNTDTYASCTGVADTSKCNTQSYVTAVNVAGICGFKDWRMPTVDELRSLVHHGRSYSSPFIAIDTNHFPNTPLGGTWSSSASNFTDDAWSVDFSVGAWDTGTSKSSGMSVRLVRSVPAIIVADPS